MVGPATDSASLFMGPLWYYLLAPLYFIFRGNPIDVLRAISIFDLATIPLFYLVGKKFFSEKVALFSSALWTLGAFPVAYARTLANPSTTVFWTLLLIYALLNITKEKRYPFIFACIILSVLFQLNLAAGLMFLPTILVLFFARIRPFLNASTLIAGLAIFALSLTPQIAFELRHSFIGLTNLSLFPTSKGVFNPLALISFHLEILLQNVVDYSYPKYKLIAAPVFLIGLILLSKTKIFLEKKFFVYWFLVPIITFVFLYPRWEAHPHYLLTWTPVVIFVLANILWYAKRKDTLLFSLTLIPLVYFNGVWLSKEIILKDHIAQPADPTRVGFNDQLRVADLIYKDADKSPFGYYAYNLLPYWADQNWQYIFSWYAKPKYGYLPERNSGKLVYIIYEPDPFMPPEYQAGWLIKFKPPRYLELNEFIIGQYQIKKALRCDETCPPKDNWKQ